MKKNLMIIAVAALGLASCKSGFKDAGGGILYNLRVDKTGPTIKEGDFVSFDLTLKTEGDSVIGSTYEQGRPAPQIIAKPASKSDLTHAFYLMSEGDSATVKLTIDSMFQKGAPKPPGVKGKYLVYEIKVEKVIPRGNTTDAVFQAHIADYFKVQSDNIKKQEPGKIKRYVEDKKLKTTTTPSGLQYQITKPGSGPNAVVGDTVLVNYGGYFLNGTVFDSNIKEIAAKTKHYDPSRKLEPLRVAVGAGNVIKGWDQGLLFLNKGSKATFVIPSELEWGEQGAQGLIPPYTPVTFDVEILDIIKPNPNAPQPAAPAVK